eukprot:CAMPEP_0172534040 /NCGR_PEP_ID=MMETSP1067-20121228/6549_1 /TAXON_ID=265564 ORGANISM="Thalassiosira punctigera, Strain Tpunct2005C2" /NCGR_SAMPLE_ID=MMETSP1067 /ASSEMBLY_ACC=CAM_ASM_000444 /LENGTH=348 /DNA_ID=CAMNT_0013318773 /DNA_START=628 /DNA_END=1674 /DNA_ORIENTATION=+
MSGYQASTTIFLQPEEFAHDEQSRLGRANGNTYQRKPGIPNVHDGQIMVRLKKKRFIILDYGYVPNNHDGEIAKAVPHISIPAGAGTAKCATKDCPRVGVPVLMYDSQPNEPLSLYLRGGMCFSCQRALNEKRRTNRKRKSEGHPAEVRIGDGDLRSVGSGSVNNCSRFKFNGQPVELNPDAVVINGPVGGTRTRGPGYRCPEIGSDLIRIVTDLSNETLSLMHSSASGGPQSVMAVNSMYQRAFLSVSKATFLLTQWKASWDEDMSANIAQATAAEAAAASANFDSRILDEAVKNNMTAPIHAQGLPDQIGFSGHVPGAGPAPGATMGLMMPEATKSNEKNTSQVEV